MEYNKLTVYIAINPGFGRPVECLICKVTIRT